MQRYVQRCAALHSALRSVTFSASQRYAALHSVTFSAVQRYAALRSVTSSAVLRSALRSITQHNAAQSVTSALRSAQVEPRLSVQMKAVSAEYLGPVMDASTRNITKSLASLTDIHEEGFGLSLAESHYRERVSRTVSLPVRGHTL